MIVELNINIVKYKDTMIIFCRYRIYFTSTEKTTPNVF